MARIRSLCEVCKDTLESMQQSDDMCVTMEVLDTANVFVKGAITATNTNLRTLDDVSDSFHELQQQAQEVHDAIETTADSGVNHDDLEEELDALFFKDVQNTPQLVPPSHNLITKEEPVPPDDALVNDEWATHEMPESLFPSAPSAVPVLNNILDTKQ
ncbi:hypothetical protein CYMTET_47705 [Cymbomonas tetramitiformis]|uniref:Uncharacterized protein n=1 Tax=Cymbomonas tetramitiformis TaxID=36881 RepID=A0AAE0BTJ8_9CHLO|nr:hypothetical protein CYMTET_47705 [Cymbomonas tetramitiformis]|eukprot:gene596-1002_t